jgi:peptide-methionine (S)-S-oxide reductase
MATQSAVFAGGCFWCTEAVFLELKGVVNVAPGYAGGTVEHPTYEQVSAGTTGHAEAIRFEYDPAVISYDDLLTVFFATHDPTTENRQGNDIGPQYRSVIFTMDDEQKAKATALIAKLNASDKLGAPVVTEVRPLDRFWPAEDYHKKYYENHVDAPYCRLVINPKLEKLQKEFSALLKQSVAGDALLVS